MVSKSNTGLLRYTLFQKILILQHSFKLLPYLVLPLVTSFLCKKKNSTFYEYNVENKKAENFIFSAFKIIYNFILIYIEINALPLAGTTTLFLITSVSIYGVLCDAEKGISIITSTSPELNAQ